METCCISSNGSNTTRNDHGEVGGAKKVTVIGIETHLLPCTRAAKRFVRQKNWENCKVACSFSGQGAFLLIYIILACITKTCVFNPLKHLSHLSIKYQ